MESAQARAQHRFQLIGCALSGILAIAIFITTGYAFVLAGSIDSTLTRCVALHLTPTQAATVLRVLIEVVTALLQALISASLAALIWSKAASSSGISFPTLMTLIASGPTGLFTL